MHTATLCHNKYDIRKRIEQRIPKYNGKKELLKWKDPSARSMIGVKKILVVVVVFLFKKHEKHGKFKETQTSVYSTRCQSIENHKTKTTDKKEFVVNSQSVSLKFENEFREREKKERKKRHKVTPQKLNRKVKEQ